MSNMSELSIAARVTASGPHQLDELAHELAHAAVAYVDGTLPYQEFRDLVDKFRDAAWVMEEAAHRDLRPSELLDALANEYAFMESATEGRDYRACHSKLQDWQRCRNGFRSMGFKVSASFAAPPRADA